MGRSFLLPAVGLLLRACAAVDPALLYKPPPCPVAVPEVLQNVFESVKKSDPEGFDAPGGVHLFSGPGAAPQAVSILASLLLRGLLRTEATVQVHESTLNELEILASGGAHLSLFSLAAEFTPVLHESAVFREHHVASFGGLGASDRNGIYVSASNASICDGPVPADFGDSCWVALNASLAAAAPVLGGVAPAADGSATAKAFVLAGPAADPAVSRALCNTTSGLAAVAGLGCRVARNATAYRHAVAALAEAGGPFLLFTSRRGAEALPAPAARLPFTPLPSTQCDAEYRETGRWGCDFGDASAEKLAWPQLPYFFSPFTVDLLSMLHVSEDHLGKVLADARARLEREGGVRAWADGAALRAALANASCTLLQNSAAVASLAAGLQNYPYVTDLHPRGGPTRGGFRVVVSGANLGSSEPPAVEVRIGNATCADARWLNDTAVACTAPAGAGAALSVSVSLGRRLLTLPGAFSYAPALLRGVALISAGGAEEASTAFLADRDAFVGQRLRLLGENYAGSDRVSCRFGRQRIVVVAHVLDDGEAECTFPLLAGGEGSGGRVDVEVSNDGVRWSGGYSLARAVRAWPGGQSAPPVGYLASEAPARVGVAVVGTTATLPVLRAGLEFSRAELLAGNVSSRALLRYADVAVSYHELADPGDAAEVEEVARAAAAAHGGHPLALLVQTSSRVIALMSAAAERGLRRGGWSLPARGPAVVSFSATLPALSNVTAYPRFRRTVVSDDREAPYVPHLLLALDQLLAQHEYWDRSARKVVLLFDAGDPFSVSYRDEAARALDAAGVSAINVAANAEDPAADLAAIEDAEAKIIVAPLFPDQMKRYFELNGDPPPALALDHLWLATSSWAGAEGPWSTALPGTIGMSQAARNASTAARIWAHTEAALGEAWPFAPAAHDALQAVLRAADSLIAQLGATPPSALAAPDRMLPALDAVYLRATDAASPFSYFVGSDANEFFLRVFNVRGGAWQDAGFVDPQTAASDHVEGGVDLISASPGRWGGVTLFSSLRLPLGAEGAADRSRAWIPIPLDLAASDASLQLLAAMQERLDAFNADPVAHLRAGALSPADSVLASSLREVVGVVLARPAAAAAEAVLRLATAGARGVASEEEDAARALLTDAGSASAGVALANASLLAGASAIAVGGRQSSYVAELAALLGDSQLAVPLLGISATSSALGDRDKYPTLFLLVGGNREQGIALASVAASVGVRRATVVDDGGAYSKDLTGAFVDAGSGFGISVNETIELGGGPSRQALQRLCERLRAHRGRPAVVLAASGSTCEAVVRYVNESCPDAVVAGSAWLSADACATSAVAASVPGSLAVAPAAGGNSESAVAPEIVASVSRACSGATAAAVARGGSGLPRLLAARAGAGGSLVFAEGATEAAFASYCARVNASGGAGPVAWQAAYARSAVDAAVFALARASALRHAGLSGPTVAAQLRAAPVVTPMGVFHFSRHSSVSSDTAFDVLAADVGGAAAGGGAGGGAAAFARAGSVDDPGFLTSRGCRPGRFREATVCTTCPVDTYKPEYGDATLCAPCPVLAGGRRMTTSGRTGASALADCRCPEGFVEVTVGSAQAWTGLAGSGSNGVVDCAPCPAGAVCAERAMGPERLLAAPGYWRGHPRALVLDRCPGGAERCAGGAVANASSFAGAPASAVQFSTPCTGAYAGVRCAACRAGFSRVNPMDPESRCRACPEPSTAAVLNTVGAVVATVYLVLGVWKASRISSGSSSLAGSRFAANLKVTIGIAQLTSFALLFTDTWDDAMQGLFATQQGVSMTPFAVIPIQCAFSAARPITEQYAGAWAAVVGAVLLLAIALRAATKASRVSLAIDTAYSGLLFTAFLLFLPVVKLALRLILCSSSAATVPYDSPAGPASGPRFLSADPTTSCADATFLALIRPLGVGMLLCAVFGFPAWLWYMLTRYRWLLRAVPDAADADTAAARLAIDRSVLLRVWTAATDVTRYSERDFDDSLLYVNALEAWSQRWFEPLLTEATRSRDLFRFVLVERIRRAFVQRAVASLTRERRRFARARARAVLRSRRDARRLRNRRRCCGQRCPWPWPPAWAALCSGGADGPADPSAIELQQYDNPLAGAVGAGAGRGEGGAAPPQPTRPRSTRASVVRSRVVEEDRAARRAAASAAVAAMDPDDPLRADVEWLIASPAVLPAALGPRWLHLRARLREMQRAASGAPFLLWTRQRRSLWWRARQLLPCLRVHPIPDAYRIALPYAQPSLVLTDLRRLPPPALLALHTLTEMLAVRRVQRRLGFMYRSYTPSAFRFEIAALLRKVVFAGIAVLLAGSRAAQVAAGLVCVVLLIVVSSVERPWLPPQSRWQAGVTLQSVIRMRLRAKRENEEALRRRSQGRAFRGVVSAASAGAAAGPAAKPAADPATDPAAARAALPHGEPSAGVGPVSTPGGAGASQPPSKVQARPASRWQRVRDRGNEIRSPLPGDVWAAGSDDEGQEEEEREQLRGETGQGGGADEGRQVPLRKLPGRLLRRFATAAVTAVPTATLELLGYSVIALTLGLVPLMDSSLRPDETVAEEDVLLSRDAIKRVAAITVLAANVGFQSLCMLLLAGDVGEVLRHKRASAKRMMQKLAARRRKGSTDRE